MISNKNIMILVINKDRVVKRIKENLFIKNQINKRKWIKFKLINKH